MKINIIIDVLRAFTFAHMAFIKGANRIILASSVSHAFSLKRQNKHFILCGEDNGVHIPGFDLDNSPTNLLNFDLYGKTLIQKTSNGTKVTLENLDADKIFVTGFSNSKTLIEYLKKFKIENLNIIPSREQEDDLAVKDYMIGLYENKQISSLETITRIIESSVAKKFFIDERFNPKDISYATSIIDCDFVMEVTRDLEINEIVLEMFPIKKRKLC